MKSITINGKECILLGNINTGKREYVFVLNDNKVEYYKKVGEEYIEPPKDLSLSGNAGGSLTELDENVSLSNLKDMLQKDFIDNKN